MQPKVLFAAAFKPFEPAIAALGDHGCTLITADGANDAVSYHGLLKTPVTPAVEAAMEQLHDDSIGKYLFTSGSTGMPKGVKISNENFVSSLNGQIKHIFSYLNEK